MKLPTEKQCLDYFARYNVPKNIFAHCLKVREVSVFLAAKLMQSGINIDQEFVSCLSLSHDLFKAVSLKTLEPNEFHKYPFSAEEIAARESLREKYPGKHEGEVAYEIFKDEYPEFALSLKNVSNPHHENPSWEEMIVHYADWRVFQEKVVPLSRRLDYLRQQYPRSDDAWNRYEKKIRQIEAKIFSNLSFDPERLGENVDKETNPMENKTNKKKINASEVSGAAI